tara:strand:- start:5264 stop:5755 length:492 start_codon:yes stop_codon:yes gene_type:complete
MATQEQLILAQLGAESSDIFKDKVDTGSGFVQDLTAGVMGAQAFDESTYALEGAVKDFKTDFRAGKIKEDSLMGRVGLEAFGENVKLSDLSIDERREAMRGRELQPRFNSDVNIYNNLVNDFTAGTTNIVLDSNAQMKEEPFDNKNDNFSMNSDMFINTGKGY